MTTEQKEQQKAKIRARRCVDALKTLSIGMYVRARSEKVRENYDRTGAKDFAKISRIPTEKRLALLMKKNNMSEVQIERSLKVYARAAQRADQKYRYRTHDLRKTARAVHLARMYIKGVPYKVVEDKAKTQPDWVLVAHFSMIGRPLDLTAFENWKMAN